MREALLLLLHQGKSFTREASAAAARHGLDLVGLSSYTENPDVVEESRRHLADCIVTDGSRLGPADIDDVIGRFAERGYAVRAAIATYEGYRLLMAELNRRLGARDSAADALALCLNKYELRRRLAESGLSAVRCHLLPGDARDAGGAGDARGAADAGNTREAENTGDARDVDGAGDVRGATDAGNTREAEDAENTGGAEGATPRLDPALRWFVKPVRGASSFAAFILDDPRTLQELPRLREQMRNDGRMAAIFMDQYDFLVEEYVEGPEFSFEIVLADDPYCLCVHEKARVDRLERTTLESMSVSPPAGVGADVIERGAEFLAHCFKELRSRGLTAGVFHVEAKYWTARDRWEVIEINPRMGGSLINASVEILTGEPVLDLWVESLVLPGERMDGFRARLAGASQLASLANPANPASRGAPGAPGTPRALKGTVFLSMYGRKGATVDSIGFDPRAEPPAIVKIHVEPGTKLDDSDRGICLMDALWEVDRETLERWRGDRTALAREADRLYQHATEGFHVSYR